MPGDEFVRFFDHHEPTSVAEHRHGGELIEDFARLIFVSIERCERQLTVVTGQNFAANARERFASQERLIAKQHTHRRHRWCFLARETRKRQWNRPCAEYTALETESPGIIAAMVIESPGLDAKSANEIARRRKSLHR